ncbi:hypothetical protein [Methylobacterium sp. GC_Met_2]|uniref:hypothetical protein n=1 Tax=Methylobacterium sp. GC_Met_2 TaxID=2937376 RepID=UPI00226BB188|nr:hypothetical protein [Methylobacterium sp. GC_Met_2]
MNAETPAVGTAGASGKNVGYQRDIPEIASTPSQVQIARLQKRFDFSPSVAAAVASLAYPQIDSWQVAR